MNLNLFSHILVLSFVADGLVNLVILQRIFSPLSLKRKFFVILRESGFALLGMFLLLFVGKGIVATLAAPQSSINVVTGFILTLLGLRAILGLSNSDHWVTDLVNDKTKEISVPCCSPVALPLIIGPGWFSYLLTVTRHKIIHNCFMIVSSWVMITIILLVLFILMEQFITKKVCETLQTVTGLLMTIIGVQLFVSGLQLAFL